MIPYLISFFAATPQSGVIGKGCAFPDSTFLGLPTWYHYLHGVWTLASGVAPNPDNIGTVCQPAIVGLNDVWLIVAAGVEILLRIAGLVAVAMVIYGGIQFITSQGEPDKATKARGTIIDALIGLVIAVVAATIVTFIAGQFNS